MYLFLNAVSQNWYIWLYGSHKELIVEESFTLLGNESTKLVPLMDSFFKKNNISYSYIENIVVVVGPGSFTWIRTISLVVNTLSYIYPHIYLTGLNFFDMFENYPIVKSSSKRDLFVKYTKSDTIQIVQNEELLVPDTQIVYGDSEVTRFDESLEIRTHIDYTVIIKNIILEKKKILEPLYIKKPNIS